MDNNQCDELKRLYTLFGYTQDGHTLLRQLISKYVNDIGRECNTLYGTSRTEVTILDSSSSLQPINRTQNLQPLVWVESIMKLKSKLDLIILNCFQGDRTMQNEINCSLEIIFKVSSFYYFNLKCR